DEYRQRLANIDLGSRETVASEFEKAKSFWLKFPVKYMHSLKNSDCAGEYIYESKNVRDSYRVRGAEDCRFVQNLILGPSKDCYDHLGWGDGAELVYYCQQVGSGAYNVRFCNSCFLQCRDMQYSIACISSNNLFGCISLRKKEYCILNKQYSKEEYEALMPKIIEHMNAMPYVDAQGRTYKYGDFFPLDMAPCAYNETLAQEFFPITKEAAEAMGSRWADTTSREYKITVPAKDMPDNIKDVSDAILQETIGCEHAGNCLDGCSVAFRIIPKELEFYRSVGIPLPRMCFRCRHMSRVALRNQPGLYERTCAKCGKPISTPYAPDRPEIVYCETCYQQEVV
ncbi:MAG: hypothetical protein WC764_03855, partial [Candidatus Paceibacterota bacterium]